MKTVLFVVCVLIGAVVIARGGRHLHFSTSTGSGKVVSDNRTVEAFTGIQVNGSGDVYLSQGQTQSIRVEADDNIIEHVRTEVKNGTLSVGLDKGSYNRMTLRVYVTIPDIRKLSVSGSGDIIGQTPINTSQLVSSIHGSGDIKLSGKATLHEVNIAGSGDVEAFDLESENATIKIAGSGDCALHVTKQLKVNIAGSGDVRYKGNPTVEQSVHGSGSVSRR